MIADPPRLQMRDKVAFNLVSAARYFFDKVRHALQHAGTTRRVLWLQFDALLVHDSGWLTYMHAAPAGHGLRRGLSDDGGEVAAALHLP